MFRTVETQVRCMVQHGLSETTRVFDLSSRARPKNASHVRGLFLRVGSTRGSLLENRRLPTRKPTGPFERCPVDAENITTRRWTSIRARGSVPSSWRRKRKLVIALHKCRNCRTIRRAASVPWRYLLSYVIIYTQ